MVQGPRARTSRLLAVVLAVSVALITAPALAHVPELESETYDAAEPMGGPDVSRATYGYLSSELELYDEYEFTVDRPITSTVGVLVPAYREHSDFRPTIKITPEAGQAIVIEAPLEDPREREFEPFSLTTFWVGGEREVDFEPDTTYTLRVSGDVGASDGRYVIVFSGPEEFDAADISATARILPAIWFGAYGGAPFRWNWWAIIPIGFAVALLGALGYGAWRWVRRLRTTG